ncbi:MAG: tRNA lysidine(34) synthetase TilS [Flavobacteriales bacterium]|nr:MAG: tRNA lysidine(34) synthetase TilS [Flavobacteriales bacterium]
MLNLENFKYQLEIIAPDFQDKRYLLAVSGGVDSMVLADLFYQLKLNFQIAHINYQLRKKDSDLDEKLVRDFCQKRNIPFQLYQVSESDQKPKNAIQEWARDLRYRFFKQIKKEEKLDFIVTAHHLNDNVETFFINFSRGTGLKGLKGIPQKNNEIIRPLLNFKKEELYAFAKTQKIDFREDKTNAKNDYVRNQLRNKIIPEMEEIQPQLIENSRKTFRYLNDAQSFIEEQIQNIQNELTITQNNNEIIFNKSALEKQSAFVQFEILRKFGFNAEKEIQKIFSAESGKIFLTKDYQLTINRNELIIRSQEPRVKNQESRTKNQDSIVLIERKEDLEKIKNSISLSDFIDFEGEFEWNFNLENIKFPVYLRRKKDGDFFYPIGMSGKKKVSNFFKDKKLSIFAKQKIWILCDNEQILGVIPFRQDRKKQFHKENSSILKITN